MALRVQRMQAVLKHARSELLRLDNVVGVGIGIKERSGLATGELAVTVLVTEKLPRSDLKAYSLVPRVLGGDCCTDVIAVGSPRLLAGFDRLKRIRPANPGVSIGHFQVTAGTLGAVVLDAETGRWMLLSNNHVLANMSNGRDGRAQIGDDILQPGSYDGGVVPDDVLGKLARFIPLYREREEANCRVARRVERAANLILRPLRPRYRLRFLRADGQKNMVDAAVASVNSQEDLTPEILGIGCPQGSTEAEPGTTVIKSGRTTGVTDGTIRAVEVTIRIQLGDLGPGLFTDQVVTTPMAQPGDSGSLVLTKSDHRVVGLLSAGSEQASVFSKWANVSKLLDVRLLPD